MNKVFKANLLLVCVLLMNLFAFAQQKHTISGFVIEKGSEEKLPGVVIRVDNTNIITNSNDYGFYSLSLPQGTYTLTIMYSGTLDTSFSIHLSSNLNLNLTVSPAITEILDEVEVIAKASNAKQVSMSAHNIEVAQIKNMPSLLGEKDVFKFLKLLPGVQKGQEGSSGFNVRGGGLDQNLIILDDAVVYNASHLFGFFSTFNGDALKSVELIKGGYNAKYGGRLSSVLNMTMKDGNMQSIKGEFGVGLLSSRLMLEGPIVKNKLSFLVSARRSYADLIARPIIKQIEDVVIGYYFYDFNAKLSYKINDKNYIYLSGYFGRDKFYSKEKQLEGLSKVNFGWGNITGTMRWNHVFNPKLFSNVTINYSNYKMQIANSNNYNNENYTIKYISQIDDIGAKADFTYYSSNNNTLRFGYQFTRHLFKPNAIIEREINSTQTNGYNTFESFENNFYVDDELKITDNWAANLGVRLSTFSTQGKMYANFEPRVSTRIMIDNSSSIKANYTIMNQYMHLLSSTGVGLPTDLWVPATRLIKPQNAIQYSVGYFKDFKNPNLSLSIEGYYKQMKNVIAYKEGATFMDINDPTSPDIRNVPFEDNITSGIGRSYGAEFMLQKNKGKFNGWLSYTLSWTQYKMADIFDGQWYFPQFDRRNDLSLVGFYNLTPKIKINALFTLATGNPIFLPTYNTTFIPYPNPDGSVRGSDFTKTVTVFNKRNEYRSETYHRMDVGIQFLKQKKRGLRTWEISFYNVYNRQNPFYYRAESRGAMGFVDTKIYKYTIFPFFPSITYSFKF